jgi:hypothetical protein
MPDYAVWEIHPVMKLDVQWSFDSHYVARLDKGICNDFAFVGLLRSKQAD